jgi:hypothetical protein
MGRRRAKGTGVKRSDTEVGAVVTQRMAITGRVHAESRTKAEGGDEGAAMIRTLAGFTAMMEAQVPFFAEGVWGMMTPAQRDQLRAVLTRLQEQIGRRLDILVAREPR